MIGQNTQKKKNSRSRSANDQSPLMVQNEMYGRDPQWSDEKRRKEKGREKRLD